RIISDIARDDFSSELLVHRLGVGHLMDEAAFVERTQEIGCVGGHDGPVDLDDVRKTMISGRHRWRYRRDGGRDIRRIARSTRRPCPDKNGSHPPRSAVRW